jgi:hypothetical protein
MNLENEMNETIEEVKKPTIRKISKVQMETMSFKRKKKAKKTPSLFDSNLVDRSYWGNDPGTDLEISLTRVQISRSLNKGEMLDIKNCRTATHLNKDNVSELMKYQLHLMTLIADENECNIFRNINGDGTVMVEFDKETEQYEFVFLK